MVQRNLKKLLFLMLLMLGVGQAAQAKRLYADVANLQVSENASWNAEAETFSWTAFGAYVTLFKSDTGFSEYDGFHLGNGEITGAPIAVQLLDKDGNVISTNGDLFSINANRNYSFDDYTDKSNVREIRVYGNSASGNVSLSDIYLVGTKKLEYSENGVAKISLSDFYATGGISVDLENNTVTCNGTEGELVLDLNNEDFSNVVSITTSFDMSSNGYTDLFGYNSGGGCEIAGVNTWTGTTYDIKFADYIASNPKDVTNITTIKFKTRASDVKQGTMKFNSMRITKNIISGTPGNETCLRDVPYFNKQTDGTYQEGTTPLWNMDGINGGCVYGIGSNYEGYGGYADLSQYEKVRLYPNDQVKLRFFFYDADPTNSNHYEVVYAQEVAGQEYLEIDIETQVKSVCQDGTVHLIAAKSYGGAYIDVSNITVIEANATSDYKLSGEGEMTEKAQTILNDANATVIDATGLTNTEAITLESANPNCLFIANEGILNQNNVLVKGEGDTYTCANLVLETGKPFRAPFEFTATSASMTKTISNQFATLILPYNATVPEGCEAYTLTSVDENNVVEGVSQEGSISANIPVLLANAGEHNFNAENVTVPVTPTELTKGLLTGVYSATQAPTNSYVLQTQDDEQAFYHATEGNEPTMNPFTAYLTYTTSNNANKLIFDLGGEVTSVENVEAATSAATVVEIYDLSGRQVSAPVKGINLMKMSDGTVKKVIVK